MNSIESYLGMIATEASEATLEASAVARADQRRFLERLEHWSGRHPDCLDCQFSVFNEDDVKRIRASMQRENTGGEA